MEVLTENREFQKTWWLGLTYKGSFSIYSFIWHPCNQLNSQDHGIMLRLFGLFHHV